MKKKEFIAGMAAGALLFGGTGAAAAGLTAQPSNQAIYVDGQRVYFTAYAVAGNHYVQLREVGRALDFGVSYDAATNSVRISPDSPYVEQNAVSAQMPAQQATPPSSQQIAKPVAQAAASADQGIDYSQEANPEIFTSTLTREFYNSARHAYLHREEMVNAYDEILHIDDASLARPLPSDTHVSDEMKGVCRALDNVFYHYDITEKYPYVYAFPWSAAELDRPQIQEVIVAAEKQTTDRDRAEYLATEICNRLEYAYHEKNTSWENAFVGNGKVICSGYAAAFQRMGRAADLFTFTVGNDAENHVWNIVYCDGEWLTVDLTHYDSTHDEAYWFKSDHPKMKRDGGAELKFAEEVLVPGSTK